MANFNLNKVILGGRLIADPELKQTNSGIPVCSFTIAVNRRFVKQNEGGAQQPTADFIRCTAWRQQAEFLSRYFHKGSSICVIGQIQTRSWDDQNGQKQYATDIVCDEINFVDSKGENGGSAYSAPVPTTQPTAQYNAPAYSSQANAAPKFEAVSNDDDLPF